MSNEIQGVMAAIRGSQMLRLLLIGFLVLVLLIPAAMIGGLVSERRERREGAVDEVTAFGLDLVTPVDQYRMAECSTQYAGLFILLTFATIWLIEVLARLRVHSIQYLLVGAAMCLFMLAAVMYLTRRIDWHATGPQGR